MKKSVYSKHQRDYTLLGTSVVFDAFMGAEMTKQFSYESSPVYILISKGILYHYISNNDAKQRATGWVKKYSDNDLILQKQQHDVILNAYNEFVEKRHTDTKKALTQLHEYLKALLPLVMVAIEVPEYFSSTLSAQSLELFFQIRLENELVYKTGFEVENFLLNQLEKECGYTPNTLQLLTLTEFNAFLHSSALPPNLIERRDYAFVERTKDAERVYLEKVDLVQRGLEDDVDLATKEIRGMIAHKGIVVGLVKVICLVSEADKIQEGDILVTSMTDPRYLPIMKKTAGFITDEGGVTCHAAIVARELKKPCIIGTKIATQVLKDGDLVEVDADKGVVRILEKHG